jgi:hypothetical protein
VRAEAGGEVGVEVAAPVGNVEVEHRRRGGGACVGDQDVHLGNSLDELSDLAVVSEVGRVPGYG